MPKYYPLEPIFQALADPTRRVVVERLAQGSVTVSQLAAAFPMALPSFMQHLGVLERAGLVVSEKTGRVRTYRLVPAAMQAIDAWLGPQRHLWQQRLNQLDEYLLLLKEEHLPTTPSTNQSPERAKNPPQNQEK